jgi:hypothetical protein
MNIKIVICFIIICFLPAVSSGATDSVWSTKTTGFIKSDESLAFENFLVKATPSSSTTASIIVFKDKTQLEKKDFKVNEFKKYDSVGITLLGIKGDYSWIAFSRLEEKDIWVSAGKTTLKWGDKYSFENHSFEIEALGKDSVNLTVSGKDSVKTDVFIKNGFKNYENIRIAVMEINRTGFIDLEFFRYKTPTINAEIITDKNEYYPDEDISVSINIISDELLNIAGISIESINPIRFQPDVFTAAGINGTKSFKSRINELPADSTIKMTAIIEWRDYFNNSYRTTVSKEVSIAPYISITKRVPEETDDENVSVELLVYNSGLNSTFIHIHDNVYDETNTRQMDWDIQLGPKKSTNLSYYIAPQKPGVYMLSTATAQWNGQKSTSKKVKLTMHMPFIRMVKRAVNNGSLTDVELEIINAGDRPAIVNVTDEIPEDYPLASGKASWTGLLEAGKNKRYGYSLQGNAFALPAAQATYRDIRGTVRLAQSNIIENNKIPGSRKVTTSPINAGQYEIMTFMISSFLVILGIIGSVAFTAYLITKTKTRSK